MNPMLLKITQTLLAVATLASSSMALHPAEIHEAGKTREPLALTRVANSGVMLASGGTKVLIDALLDKARPLDCQE
jgi:hypothetical protein